MFTSLEGLQEAERFMLAQALPTLDEKKTDALIDKIENLLEASEDDNATVLFALHTILYDMTKRWLVESLATNEGSSN